MKIRKEIQIALVAILAIVILFFGLQFLKGLNIFSSGNVYNVSLHNAKGLTAANPVYSDGFKVGVVRSVVYDYNNNGSIKAEIELDKDMKVPVGSTAEVASDLLGNVQMNLSLSKEKEFIEVGGNIRNQEEVGTLSKMADMIPTVEKMLPKLDSIMASLNALLADPSIAGSLHNIETISSNLTTSTRELNTMMAMLNEELPTTINKADKALDKANTMMTKVNDLDLTQTMAKVNATLANLESFSKTLNSKEGSLGLLLHDKELYNNLNTTLKDADALLVNFKEHPKRYIHFSVFGKKDK